MENTENRNNSMAGTKEIAVNLVNFEKQNGLNAINQKSRNKRLFTWKTIFICVINGKCFSMVSTHSLFFYRSFALFIRFRLSVNVK